MEHKTLSKGLKKWIPVQTLYNKELLLGQYLKGEGIEYYIPMKYELYETKEDEERCERRLVPAIHNLVFIRHEYDYEWCRGLAQKANIPLYFIKRTREGQEFCTVDDKEMENFIHATNPEVEGTRFIDPEKLKGKKAVWVRVVRKGPLYGVVGEFIRYGGKHYIAIKVAQSAALMKVSYTWCEIITDPSREGLEE